MVVCLSFYNHSWVAESLEIGMFVSPYIQKVNQRIRRGNQSAIRHRGDINSGKIAGTTDIEMG